MYILYKSLNGGGGVSLSTVRVGQDAHNATDASLGECLLVPLQQMSTGTLRGYFEATIYVFHEHIDKIVLLQRIDSLIHLC